MKNMRLLTLLNLVGALVLAGFCAVQWHGELLLRRQVEGLLQTKAANEKEIAGHKQTIDGLSADLAHFKQYFADTKEQLSATQKVLRKVETDNARLNADCVQLRENIKVWEQAVKERDEHLAELNSRLKDFAERLNDSIRRHNELARRHNEVVGLLNTTRQQLAQAYKDLDEARRKLYKALGVPIPEKKAAPKEANSSAGGEPKPAVTPTAAPAGGKEKRENG
ncbi:MAG: hypothetical protein LBS59_02750 [Puniceicoccales bacterium]|jgi:septal ring factor EnvC (AmiA/AmiB activator)|nr:hypothetical protein [Puniceicoccales bacterium]